MTLHAYYRLTCTNCNRYEYAGYSPESPEELREQAGRDGWVYGKVPNGSRWDFCPACVKRGKHIPESKGE